MNIQVIFRSRYPDIQLSALLAAVGAYIVQHHINVIELVTLRLVYRRNVHRVKLVGIKIIVLRFVYKLLEIGSVNGVALGFLIIGDHIIAYLNASAVTVLPIKLRFCEIPQFLAYDGGLQAVVYFLKEVANLHKVAQLKIPERLYKPCANTPLVQQRADPKRLVVSQRQHARFSVGVCFGNVVHDRLDKISACMANDPNITFFAADGIYRSCFKSVTQRFRELVCKHNYIFSTAVIVNKLIPSRFKLGNKRLHIP